MGGVGDPVLRGRGIEQGRGSMQLTGEEACWLMLGRESKIASSLEEQQWSFSEGSSKRQHSGHVDVETRTTKTLVKFGGGEVIGQACHRSFIELPRLSMAVQ